MISTLLQKLPWVLGTLTLAGPVRAQAPKMGGEYYTEVARYGFRFRPPKGWAYVPPTPGAAHVIGLWAPSGEERTISVGNGKFMYPRCVMLAFDRRPQKVQPPPTEQERTREYLREGARVRDFPQWVAEQSEAYIGTDFRLMREQPLELEDLEGAREVLFRGTSHALTDDSGSAPSYAFAGLYSLSPELDIALCFTAPARSSKWSKWEREVRRMLRSFAPTEVLFDPADLAGLDLRERRKAQLEAQVQSQPGWRLVDTQNYFILSSSEDEALVQELESRLELLRTTFQACFPEPVAQAALRARAGTEAIPGMPVEDPLLPGRCSVVRLCKDRSEYFAYGAPAGSAGYWFALEEELVLYDDQADRGRDYTWRVLAHEAFHQYIHYYSGNLEPHPWFNEGHAEYYAGYQMGRFGLTRGPLRERDLAIQAQVREGRYAPLERLLRWSRQELYGGNSLRLTQLENYAQSWSLVWFLRTGAETSRAWKPEWSTILDTYAATLVGSGDATKALEAAFEGIDVNELESAWLAFVEKG